MNKMPETFVAHDEEAFDGVMTNGIRPMAEGASIISESALFGC